MTDKVSFVDVESFGTIETHAIIDRGNGEFTSMLKSTYDAQQVEHLTEIPPQAALSTPIVNEATSK